MLPQQALLAGIWIGLMIAVPVGPMAVLVIQRTLARGFRFGLATAAGASTINLLYALVATLSLEELASRLLTHRAELGFVVALILLVLALRMLLRVSATGGGRADAEYPSLWRNYLSAAAFNALNPLGFALLLGAMSAATGFAAQVPSVTAMLAAGVFIGSIAWWLVLVTTIATIGCRLSRKQLRILDVAAACAMMALAIRTMLISS